LTRTARRVLDDCRLAHAMLEDVTEPEHFRIIWVAALALTRSVGQILDKINGTDRSIRDAAKARYELWKGDTSDHLIFREFIKKERDLIIHEYSSNLDLRSAIPIALVDGRPALVGENDPAINDAIRLDQNIFRPLTSGPWAGEDARDILLEAIEWWESELRTIDAMLRPNGGCES
jgi:hypothetical protein